MILRTASKNTAQVKQLTVEKTLNVFRFLTHADKNVMTTKPVGLLVLLNQEICLPKPSGNVSSITTVSTKLNQNLLP